MHVSKPESVTRGRAPRAGSRLNHDRCAASRPSLAARDNALRSHPCVACLSNCTTTVYPFPLLPIVNSGPCLSAALPLSQRSRNIRNIEKNQETHVWVRWKRWVLWRVPGVARAVRQGRPCAGPRGRTISRNCEAIVKFDRQNDRSASRRRRGGGDGGRGALDEGEEGASESP